MRITVNRNELAQAIANVAPFAPTKPAIAILRNMRITTKGNRMKIEANGIESAMTQYIDNIESMGDVQFLVDAQDLNKFVSKTNGETIELDYEGTTLTVIHSNGQAVFPSEAPENYPAFENKADNITEIRIPAKELAESISLAKSFVATDTLRPVLCAIYAYVKDGQFGFCGTDTSKLIHGYNKILCDPSVDVHWLIMPSSFSSLQKMCSTTTEDVLVKITDKIASYKIGNAIISTVMASGKYPLFQRVIPTQSAMALTINKDALMDCINRIAVLSDQKRCLKIGIDNDVMKLSISNIERGTESDEKITVNGCNGNITFGVNIENLTACAKSFKSDSLKMELTDASRPIAFRTDNLVVIAMPMQLM